MNDVRSKARPNTKKSSGGRPAKLKAVDKRNLVRLISTGKANTATQLVRELKDSTKVDVGADTIRRVLKEAGMKAITKNKSQNYHQYTFANALNLQNDINIGQ